MMSQSDTVSMSAGNPAAVARMRPFFWSVRREIWENPFIYIAPVAVAGLVLVAFAIGTWHLQHILLSHQASCKPGPCQTPPPGLPYSIAAIAVLLTGILVGCLYCLNALYGERRDRSILFWKSLPVSDLVAVLSKASIPLIVIPAIIFIVTIGMQLVMLALSSLVVLIQGESLPAFWNAWPVLRMALVLIYGLATLALWHAPLYGWLLLVSAWARRVPFLWALLTPLALCLGEKIGFDTSILGNMLVERLAGSFDAAFDGLGQNQGMPIRLDQLTPLRFLGTPELWLGLAVTAAFLAMAIRLRRSHGPL